MNVANPTSQSTELRIKPAGSGGGADGWHVLGPNGTYSIILPANSMWQVESRLLGSQLISSIQAPSDAEIELVLSGARIRPQLLRQPIEV